MLLLILFGVFYIIKFVIHVTNARCRSFKNLAGKTALITGGNSGLGLELAKNLAVRGCTIIIADKNNGTETVKNLIKESNNANIYYEYVDFASFKSVRAFAQEYKKKFGQLHILVNNAGVGYVQGKTEDDLQGTIQINYFSHFLLTHLLLDLLLKSSPSRIIFTSSLLAYIPLLHKDNIKGYENKWGILQSFFSYNNSKVALALMSRTLAKKLKKTGVTSNAHHPGLVKTNIGTAIASKGVGILAVLAFRSFLWLWGKTADEGVQTMLHLATSDKVENKTGKYFMECIPVWQPPVVYNDTFREKMWNLSEEYVKLNPDEKVDAIIKRFNHER